MSYLHGGEFFKLQRQHCFHNRRVVEVSESELWEFRHDGLPRNSVGTPPTCLTALRFRPESRHADCRLDCFYSTGCACARHLPDGSAPFRRTSLWPPPGSRE